MKLRFTPCLRLLVLCCFFGSVVSMPALATEQKSWLESVKLSEATMKTLEDTFPEHTVQFGRNLKDSTDDQFEGLILLLTGEKTNLICILRKQGNDYEVVAVNDTIIPPGHYEPYYREGLGWVLADKDFAHEYSPPTAYFYFGANSSTIPHLEYTGSPKGLKDFYLIIRRNDRGEWTIRYAEYIWWYEDGSSYCAIQYANQETALKIRLGGNWLLYVPLAVDLHFDQFDSEAARAYIYEMLEDMDGPHLIPSTGKQWALPQGVAAELKPGQAYPVYSGPGLHYAPGGEADNPNPIAASVAAPQWIQVYGREGDWLFIQYHASRNTNRFGYIPADALAVELSVPELVWLNEPYTMEGWIAFDPMRT